MDIELWKNDIVSISARQITFQNNMSNSEISQLKVVLLDYLEEGLNILRNWRKLKNDDEFLSGKHNNGLVAYVKNRYQANGREIFGEYSSGGIQTNMYRSPESVLKSTCKQVM